jgi:hypothetical protein
MLSFDVDPINARLPGNLAKQSCPTGSRNKQIPNLQHRIAIAANGVSKPIGFSGTYFGTSWQQKRLVASRLTGAFRGAKHINLL